MKAETFRGLETEASLLVLWCVSMVSLFAEVNVSG